MSFCFRTLSGTTFRCTTASCACRTRARASLPGGWSTPTPSRASQCAGAPPPWRLPSLRSAGGASKRRYIKCFVVRRAQKNPILSLALYTKSAQAVPSVRHTSYTAEEGTKRKSALLKFGPLNKKVKSKYWQSSVFVTVRRARKERKPCSHFKYFNILKHESYPINDICMLCPITAHVAKFQRVPNSTFLSKKKNISIFKKKKLYIWLFCGNNVVRASFTFYLRINLYSQNIWKIEEKTFGQSDTFYITLIIYLHICFTYINLIIWLLAVWAWSTVYSKISI